MKSYATNTIIHSHLAGVLAAPLIPMSSTYQCDIQELVSHCQDLLAKGMQGLVFFGTTGEGPSFSVEERCHILRAVIEQGVPPQCIVACVACCALQDAVALATAAASLGCRAILLSPPFYYKNVSEEGVITFYREVLLRLNNPKLKIYLYHIPPLTGVHITLRIIAALIKEFPTNVIGIKESEGNILLVDQIRNTFPLFEIFVGNELTIYQAIQRGAQGVVSGIANLYPGLILSHYKNALLNSAQDEEKIQAIFSAITHYPIVPALKAALANIRGSTWHHMRPPLIPLLQEQQKKLLKALSRLRDENSA